jgi:transcriptional regulator with XRE-family HTH domain
MRSRETDRLGEVLRRRRQEAQLTQEELAEKAGLSVRGIQDLERGLRRNPQPATARGYGQRSGHSRSPRQLGVLTCRDSYQA